MKDKIIKILQNLPKDMYGSFATYKKSAVSKSAERLYDLFSKAIAKAVEEERKRILKEIDKTLIVWTKNHPDCLHEDDFRTPRLWYVKNFIIDLKDKLLAKLKKS